LNIPIYQVDAFASELFAGNPAAVCVLDQWLDDAVLQAIAAENNLSETAYLVRNPDGYELRWFTPTTEVTLCGHATLACAYVVFQLLKRPELSVRFQSRWSGILEVTRDRELLTLNFPLRPVKRQLAPDGLMECLGVEYGDVFEATEDLMVVLADEQMVRSVAPDFARMQKIACRGIIVTSRGTDCDFVSRFFAPSAGIPEDPVTGSAHCALAPYWAGILGKKIQHAKQVSKRGGELTCEVRGDRVLISGRAIFYMEGVIQLPTFPSLWDETSPRNGAGNT